MTKLDAFTLNVLCNTEVIDIDQDSLGKQGRIVRQENEEFILSKPLDDGSLAVGLFNLSPTPRTITVKWSDLGVKGRQRVRDVWRQDDLGTFKNISLGGPQSRSHLSQAYCARHAFWFPRPMMGY